MDFIKLDDIKLDDIKLDDIKLDESIFFNETILLQIFSFLNFKYNNIINLVQKLWNLILDKNKIWRDDIMINIINNTIKKFYINNYFILKCDDNIDINHKLTYTYNNIIYYGGEINLLNGEYFYIFPKEKIIDNEAEFIKNILISNNIRDLKFILWFLLNNGSINNINGLYIINNKLSKLWKIYPIKNLKRFLYKYANIY